jgi:hypothetical protein
VLTNAAGCDSTVTLNLTINNATTSIDVQTACDSYSWIDGNTYTSNNNTATHTVTNTAGCDSVVTLNLTVNPVNVNVSNNSPTLTADAFGATYQWIDCDDNSPISGETNQSFEATTNGNFAVIVTIDNCSDTSDCQEVNNVGTLELDLADDIVLFPNPNDGKFQILVPNSSIQRIEILDFVGKKIPFTMEIVNSEGIAIEVESKVSSVVIVRIVFSNGIVANKFVSINN